MRTDQSTALLLILHGSPNEEANLPAVRLASSLQNDPRFQRTMVAYMECNEPSIPGAVELLADAGIRKIIAIPWFLHAGRHLVLDVPSLLNEASNRHPEMEILITNPVGTSPQLARALEYRAEETLNRLV